MFVVYKIILMLFISFTSVFAHKLILSIVDNDDDTLTVIGGYDTGQSAANANIKVESLNSGKILFEKRLPDESELIVKIPDEPYQIVLDGGPGHQDIKKGIPPKGGFKVKLDEAKKQQPASNAKGLNLPYIITLSIALLLMILTMYFSYRNTRKLLEKQSLHVK